MALAVLLRAAIVQKRTMVVEVRRLNDALAAAESEREEEELLFRIVVENASMAIVVYGDTGGILYSNAEVREMFFEGQSLDGHDFLKLLKEAPESLR